MSKNTKEVQRRGRTSHEVRGLKCKVIDVLMTEFRSHLTRGAWIEMHIKTIEEIMQMSHLTRGAWIEMRKYR